MTEPREQLLADLATLVRIPSRSWPEGGEESAVQALVAERFRAAGGRVRSFEVDDLPGARSHPVFCGPERQYEGRPTVVAEFGPSDAPALLLAAHSDTVPIFEPEKWTVEPFSGLRRDGGIYGLGVCDDKWGTATLLALARTLGTRSQPLPKRVILASSIDEEHGVGNGLLLLHLAGVQAEAAFYLDGGQFQHAIGNCGGSNYLLRPQGERSPADLEDDLCALSDMATAMSAERQHLFERPYFDDNIKRHASINVWLRQHATGPVLLVAFYTLPGETRAGFCADLEPRVAAALGPRFAAYQASYREPWFEPALADPATPAFRLLAAVQEAMLGRPPIVSTVSKQDAFVLQNHARIPTLSFGVGRFDGPGAYHQPDEFVPDDDSWAGCQIVHEAVERWLREGC